MTQDPQMAALLDDYIGLFTKDKLERWFELFLPGATVTSANADGSLKTWNCDEFFARQRAAFATGLPIRELFENTQAERTGRLAEVRSDFVWTNGTLTRRGRLMLLLIEEKGRLLIQALTFSYAD